MFSIVGTRTRTMVMMFSFVGDNVCTQTGTFYVLVHVEGYKYDSLSCRTYEDDLNNDREAEHVLAVDKVVRNYIYDSMAPQKVRIKFKPIVVVISYFSCVYRTRRSLMMSLM